jgi:hypothetical protein
MVNDQIMDYEVDLDIVNDSRYKDKIEETLLDIPTISLMAVSGHKTERAFLSDIRVTPEEHAKKLREHWQKNAKLRIA